MQTTTLKIIKPRSERRLIDDIAEIWACRELLLVLVRREIFSRYRQSIVGLLAWVLLQPLLTTAIFTIVFVVFIRIPSQPESYPLFAFAGLAVWQYFNRAVTEGGNSLVVNVSLVTKVAFPRLIIPLVAPVAAMLDSFIAIAVLVVTALLMGAHVSATVILAPCVIFAVGLFGYAIALWTAPLNAVYRDVGIAVPFIMQIAMYMGPVVYPTSLVPENIRWLYQLNPVAVMVDAMRWVVLGSSGPSPEGMVVFVLLTGLLLWGGSRLFRHMEGNFVDRI